MDNSIDLNSSDFQKTLKQCSCDDSQSDNKEYMTESELPAIGFDTVKQSYAKLLGLHKGIVRSVDALLKNERTKTDYLIEFKNGKIVTKKRELIEENDVLISEIKEKIRDSLLIYNDINKTFISNTRNNVALILVYNESKNPNVSESQQTIHKAVMSRAEEEIVRFKLSNFHKIYFKEVHTYTEAQFEDFLAKEFCYEPTI